MHAQAMCSGCSHPQTITEPAKEKVEYDYSGNLFEFSPGCVAGGHLAAFRDQLGTEVYDLCPGGSFWLP
jgi:hypothetical protein